jgi:hypothetical protein
MGDSDFFEAVLDRIVRFFRPVAPSPIMVARGNDLDVLAAIANVPRLRPARYNGWPRIWPWQESDRALRRRLLEETTSKPARPVVVPVQPPRGFEVLDEFARHARMNPPPPPHQEPPPEQLELGLAAPTPPAKSDRPAEPPERHE